MSDVVISIGDKLFHKACLNEDVAAGGLVIQMADVEEGETCGVCDGILDGGPEEVGDVDPDPAHDKGGC